MAISVNLPDFKTDPYFKKSQDLSFTTGKGILGGKLPEFYKGLGETGSKQFQDMLSLVNRDTATAVNENLVRRNIKGGVGLSSIAKATADATTNLSWTDYQKAAGEKQSLLGTGLDTISGVRGAGLQYAGQENQFGLKGAEMQLSADKFNVETQWREDQAEEAKKARKNQMWQTILGAGIGAIGTIAGGYLAGGGGSGGGGSLGSAGGGGAITRATPKQYDWGGGF